MFLKKGDNMSDYKIELMQLAAQEAQSNVGTQIGGPFGSVIVKDGKVIATGHNQVLQDHDPTAHGEVTTIRKACEVLKTHDLSGCTLYTNAYPCPMCLGAIIWANIKTVYYGNTPEDAEKIGFRDDFIYDFIKNDCADQSVLAIEQHDRDLTIQSFDAFSDDQSHTLY